MFKKIGLDIWYVFVGTCTTTILIGIPMQMIGNYYGYAHSKGYNTWIYALDILLLPWIVICERNIGKYICDKIYDYITL